MSQDISTLLYKGALFLLDLLYPPHCVSCGRAGAWLCDECVAKISFLQPPFCLHCGLPLAKPGLCWQCQQNESYLEGLRSMAWHVSPLQEAVHALKYEGVRVLAAPLGELLAQRWVQDPLPVEVIVPVPLYRLRLRQRGYNQALLLARELATRLSLPLCADVLQRVRNTRSQVGLSRRERWENVWGAFQCSADAFAGARVLLVDDVCTTGATLEASAAALREAGARSVWALTLARAPQKEQGKWAQLPNGQGGFSPLQCQ